MVLVSRCLASPANPTAVAIEALVHRTGSSPSCASDFHLRVNLRNHDRQADTAAARWLRKGAVGVFRLVPFLLTAPAPLLTPFLPAVALPFPILSHEVHQQQDRDHHDCHRARDDVVCKRWMLFAQVIKQRHHEKRPAREAHAALAHVIISSEALREILVITSST